jgi:hypothetical protein
MNVSLCPSILSREDISYKCLLYSNHAGIYHSRSMIVTNLSLLVIVLVILLSTATMVESIAGRCYLCSQATLAECVGSIQPDSPLYNTVLQYYTEPCNGQCVLFQSEQLSTIRGCSWTYGHMAAKSTGWHDISPGIRAYFCNSYLCNNGTYQQPEISLTRAAMPPPPPQNEYSFMPQVTMHPQPVLAINDNTFPTMNIGKSLLVVE